MRFLVTVEVTLRHSTGKFASREDLSERIIEAVGECDPGTIDTDDGGEYEVEAWEAVEVRKPGKGE